MSMPAEFAFPTIGTRVSGRALLLAIDNVSLPLKKDLCYFLTRPTLREEPVVAPSRDNRQAPDYFGAYLYGTVLYDAGRFRMWYYGLGDAKRTDWPEEMQALLPESLTDPFEGPMCYAESEDGVHWTKPALHQFRYFGSEVHNAIALPYVRVCCHSIIKDDEEPDQQRRYKMAYWYMDARNAADYPRFATAVSADGIRWQSLNGHPSDLFIEHASLYKHHGLYVINGQSFCGFTKSEGGHDSGRQAYAIVSPDFETWLDEWADSFLLPEPENPAERGAAKPYDQVHIGVGAASFGTVLVGIYCRWHDAPRFSEISGDFGLVVSNDGLAFREPVPGYTFISAEESPAPPVPGKELRTILCQGNGILNVGDTTYIYYGRWCNGGQPTEEPAFTLEDHYSEIALATLPRDRWGALGLYPNKENGSVWTAPVTLPAEGCRLLLNADGVDGITVEVADERFRPLAGFSGDELGHAAGPDGLDCPVTWAGHDLCELGGRTVRFRVHLRADERVNPRLYAMALECDS